MNKLLLIFTLLFSTLMLSTPSYAEWTKVGENTRGSNFYVDFDRIRKHDGYIYWWGLTDYLKPNKLGLLSGKTYHQGDCKLFRYKYLSFLHYEQPMGRGSAPKLTSSPKNPEWEYPPPNSANEEILKQVCSR
jgi:hypothetical protein